MVSPTKEGTLETLMAQETKSPPATGYTFLPWDNFQVTTIFINAHKNKKQCVLSQLLGSTTFKLSCFLWGLQAGEQATGNVSLIFN